MLGKKQQIFPILWVFAEVLTSCCSMESKHEDLAPGSTLQLSCTPPHFPTTGAEVHSVTFGWYHEDSHSTQPAEIVTPDDHHIFDAGSACRRPDDVSVSGISTCACQFIDASTNCRSYLNVTNVEAEDSGLYTCNVTIGGEIVRAESRLIHVLRKPAIYVLARQLDNETVHEFTADNDMTPDGLRTVNVSIFKDIDATFKFTVDGSYPKASVKCRFGNIESNTHTEQNEQGFFTYVRSFHVEKLNGLVYIECTVEVDHAEFNQQLYIMRVRNDKKGVAPSGRVEIKLVNSQTIPHSQSDDAYEVKVDDSLYFSCDATHLGIPRGELGYIKVAGGDGDGVMQMLPQDDEFWHLKISELSPGMYKCAVENPFGRKVSDNIITVRVVSGERGDSIRLTSQPDENIFDTRTMIIVISILFIVFLVSAMTICAYYKVIKNRWHQWNNPPPLPPPAIPPWRGQVMQDHHLVESSIYHRVIEIGHNSRSKESSNGGYVRPSLPPRPPPATTPTASPFFNNLSQTGEGSSSYMDMYQTCETSATTTRSSQSHSYQQQTSSGSNKTSVDAHTTRMEDSEETYETVDEAEQKETHV